MAARKPTTVVHRGYVGSIEQINNLPAADDQIFDHVELNDQTDTLKNHADLLDIAELKWYAGFTLQHTWVVAEDGSKKPFHAHAGATAELIAATVPGTNSAVWVSSVGPETDFVAAYNSAKT